MTVSAYQASAGWNNSAALATMALQPASPGILESPWQWAVDGSASTLVQSTKLTYKGSITPAQFNAACTELGVTMAAKTAQRTLRLLQNDRTTWANYNVNVQYPNLDGTDGKYELGFYHDVQFPVQIIGAAS